MGCDGFVLVQTARRLLSLKRIPTILIVGLLVRPDLQYFSPIPFSESERMRTEVIRTYTVALSAFATKIPRAIFSQYQPV